MKKFLRIIKSHNFIYASTIIISCLFLFLLFCKNPDVKNFAFAIFGSGTVAGVTGIFIELSNKSAKKYIISNIDFYVKQYLYSFLYNFCVVSLKHYRLAEFNNLYEIKVGKVNECKELFTHLDFLKYNSEENYLKYSSAENLINTTVNKDLQSLQSLLNSILSEGDIILLSYFNESELNALKNINNYIISMQDSFSFFINNFEFIIEELSKIKKYKKIKEWKMHFNIENGYILYDHKNNKIFNNLTDKSKPVDLIDKIKISKE